MSKCRLLVILVAIAIVAHPASRLMARQLTAYDQKLLIWYDVKDPAGTFQHRAYDLRKKPFDEPAVTAWIERIHRDFPHYRVQLRDIRLADWPGANDEERLLQAVQHEVGLAYPPVRRLERQRIPSISVRPLEIESPHPLRPLPDRVPGLGAQNPLGTLSNPPFPIPYPRPHP